MATKPGLVPDTAKYLIIHGDDEEVCGRYSSLKECYDWIFDQHVTKQDNTAYEVYAPVSRHEPVLTTKIIWEKSNG